MERFFQILILAKFAQVFLLYYELFHTIIESVSIYRCDSRAYNAAINYLELE